MEVKLPLFQLQLFHQHYLTRRLSLPVPQVSSRLQGPSSKRGSTVRNVSGVRSDKRRAPAAEDRRDLPRERLLLNRLPQQAREDRRFDGVVRDVLIGHVVRFRYRFLHPGRDRVPVVTERAAAGARKGGSH